MPPSSPDGSASVAGADHAGLQHQAHRLAHRHEVALHVGMRDGQRAAARELALEQRHHRAGAAEHVAEAHGDAAHAARRLARGDVQRLAIHLGQPLRRAHHEVGFTALSVEISTIASAPDAARRVGDMAGAGDVGQQALQRVGLDHRHVLQRGGVEHQFGATSLEHGADARLVADVGDAATGGGTCGWRLGQFQVDLPQRVFAVVEQDQLLGPERGDLARQLAADGAAGAGHDDAPALDQPRHAVAVERHLRAVQQVLDRDRLQFQMRPPVAWRRGRARSGAARGGPAALRGRPAPPARRGVAPDRSGVVTTSVAGRRPSRAQPLQHCGGVVDRAEDGVAVDAPPGLAVPSASRPSMRSRTSRSPARARRNRSTSSAAPTSSTVCAASCSVEGVSCISR